MLRRPLASPLVAAAVAGLVLCVPAAADAQRAAAFGKDARPFVTIDAPGIRIDDVRIVDGTGAPARTGQALLIRDGRIARIGPAAELASEAADVVGPICESSDYLAKGRWLPPMARGDLVCTFSAGAYGMAMSSNYNSRPRAAEVLVDGTNHKLIRRRETYDDLVAHELL